MGGEGRCAVKDGWWVQASGYSLSGQLTRSQGGCWACAPFQRNPPGGGVQGPPPGGVLELM